MDSTIAICLENDTIVRKNMHKYGRDTEKLKVLKGNLTIPNSSLLQLAHGCQQKISPALKPQIQIFSNPEIKNKTRKLLILLSVSCLLTHLVAFYDACYCYGPAVDTILTPYTHMEARSTLTLQPIDC